MDDDIKMVKVKFSFRVGLVTKTEVVEVEDNVDDKELDEMLSDWLWEKSNATWTKE